MIAASAGNHAQAVAYHAKRLGIPATIVMPAPTPTMKVTQTEGHGARVVLHGAMFDDAHAKARELELENGYVFVHPFDDPQVIAGAGHGRRSRCSRTRPTSTRIVVPIGGGGLMSGIAIAARALKPDIELIGVEAELYPSMKCAVEGCHLPLGGDTLAEGIAVKEPGELTSRILHELADDIVLVAERDLERAVAMLVGIEKTVVEGAGAAGLAAMLADPERFAGKKVGDRPVRRQYRHPSARQRAGPRPRPRRAASRGCEIAAQDRPGALAAITAQVPRGRRQHHRDQPQPDLHPAAGQGHGDRGRVRGARRRRRSTTSWRGSKPPASTSSARSLD